MGSMNCWKVRGSEKRKRGERGRLEGYHTSSSSPSQGPTPLRQAGGKKQKGGRGENQAHLYNFHYFWNGNVCARPFVSSRLCRFRGGGGGEESAGRSPVRRGYPCRCWATGKKGRRRIAAAIEVNLPGRPWRQTRERGKEKKKKGTHGSKRSIEWAGRTFRREATRKREILNEGRQEGEGKERGGGPDRPETGGLDAIAIAGGRKGGRRAALLSKIENRFRTWDEAGKEKGRRRPPSEGPSLPSGPRKISAPGGGGKREVIE